MGPNSPTLLGLKHQMKVLCPWNGMHLEMICISLWRWVWCAYRNRPLKKHHYFVRMHIATGWQKKTSKWFDSDCTRLRFPVPYFCIWFPVTWYAFLCGVGSDVLFTIDHLRNIIILSECTLRLADKRKHQNGLIAIAPGFDSQSHTFAFDFQWHDMHFFVALALMCFSQ